MIFILLILLTASIACGQEQWETDPYDWWDLVRRSARLSYGFRESQQAIWLENEDATALRGTVGSISTSRFYVSEELRLAAPLDERLLLRFHYTKLEDYGVKQHNSRLELEYRSRAGWMAGVLGSAFHEKEDFDLGLIAGYLSSPRRFARLRWIAHRLLYNEKNQEQGRYTAFPHRFILEIRVDPSQNLRLFVDGFAELPSRQWIDAPLTGDDPDFRNTENYAVQFRLERTGTQGVEGVRAGIESGRLREEFEFHPSWELRSSKIRIKCYSSQRHGHWSWESELPMDFCYEKKDSSGYGTAHRKRVVTEFYPQFSLRRSFRGMPFAELNMIMLYRNPRQTGDLERPGSDDQISARIGIAAGLAFSGGASHRLPHGELRLRVMQNLDRSWSGNFGGGSLTLVLSY